MEIPAAQRAIESISLIKRLIIAVGAKAWNFIPSMLQENVNK